jgi:hypothetical protein
MQRIDRLVRTVAVAIASALLIACGSDEATAPPQAKPPTPPAQQPPADSLPPDTLPTPPSSVIGTWTSFRIDGKPLPATIAGGTDEGITWELRVLQDTLVIASNGRWVQRVRTRQVQSDGFNVSSVWGDRGTWTRDGDTIHFESDWIQNVAFDAELASDGTLRVHHNFTLDETLPAMLREMQR